MPAPSLPFGQSSAGQLFGTGPDLSAFAAKPPSVVQGSQLPSSAAEFSRADVEGLLKPPEVGVSEAEMKAALSPISQTAPMQMPASLTREIPIPQRPQMRTGAIGAGAARGQGIGNAISQSIGALAQFKAARDKTKQEADATRVQRYIEAQHGMSQADQVLAGDPQNAAALESKQHNQAVMQGMLQDPKFVKTMEKGFNISLTDPSANKTPEHGIVQRGIDLFKKKSQQPFTPDQAAAMSQKLQAAQPKQLGPNVMAQQNLQLKMEQQKAQIDAYKERVALAKEMISSTGKLDVERLKAVKDMQIAQFNADKSLALESMRFGNEKYLAGYKSSLEVARDRLKRQEDDKDVYQFMKAYDSNTKDYTTGMSEINKDINATLTKMHAKDITDADRAELRTSLDRLYQTQRVLQSNHDTFAGLASKVLGIPTEQLRGDAPPNVGEGVKPGGQASTSGTPAGGSPGSFAVSATGGMIPLTQGSSTSSTGGAPDARTQQSTPDFEHKNPFTGDSYPGDYPAADKFLLEQLFHASQVSGAVSGEARAAEQELESGAKSVEEWFKDLPADLKKLVKLPTKDTYRDREQRGPV